MLSNRHVYQGVFQVFTFQVFSLNKQDLLGMGCFGSASEAVGECLGSNVLGSSWGVAREH